MPEIAWPNHVDALITKTYFPHQIHLRNAHTLEESNNDLNCGTERRSRYIECSNILKTTHESEHGKCDSSMEETETVMCSVLHDDEDLIYSAS